jgi:hypothetical protein
MVYDPALHPAGLERDFFVSAIEALGITCTVSGNEVTFAAGEKVEVIFLRSLVTRHTIGHVARQFDLEQAQIWDEANRQKKRQRFRPVS